MYEEKEYVTTGALIKCNCGSLITPLRSSTSTVELAGQLACTTSDKIPMVNIMPFGICKTKMTPCIPALLLWLDFQPDVVFEGANPLLNTSWIMCSIGGKIEIVHTGQH